MALEPDEEAAVADLEERAKTVALEFMKMHPSVGKLRNEELRGLCLKSLHSMTTELEIIKKHLILAKDPERDGSTEL